MHYLGRVALFLLLLAGDPLQAQTLSLSASKNSPYVGEVIDITLTFQGSSWKTTPQPTLTIPWLKSITGWLVPLDQWVSKQSEATANALPLRWQEKTIYAIQKAADTWQLRWQLVVAMPEGDGSSLTLGAAQAGAITSKSLSLEVQRPPAMIASPALWDLGVGTYRISARWLQSRVALGEEATLEFIVEGTGNLATVSAPKLMQFPGWEGDRFSLQIGNAISNVQQRLFQVLIRPRQLQARFAPITARYFDPLRETIVTQQVAIPALAITSAAVTLLQPGSTIDDALRQLTKSQQAALYQRDARSWRTALSWLLWLPVLAALAMISRSLLERFLPGWLAARRWQHALRRGQQQWKESAPTPARLRHVLAELLSVRVERPVQPDDEALCQAVATTPLAAPLAALLHQAEQWEFGPTNTKQQAAALHQVDLFFTEARQP